MSTQSLNSKPVFFKKGEQAFLFLHGFTSTPSSLLPTAEGLAEKGWTISIPVLPGHGETAEAMAKTSGRDWLDAALTAYDALAADYEKPAVAGLSMGGALALHVAANRPVPAVVALAPALYLNDWRVHFIPLMKLLIPWQNAIGNDIKSARFKEESYQRYKIKNIQDLLFVMRTVRGDLNKITAPLLTVQSKDDHTVPPTCMDDLVKWTGSNLIRKYRLTDCYHVITMDNEYEKIINRMHDFFTDYLK